MELRRISTPIHSQQLRPKADAPLVFTMLGVSDRRQNRVRLRREPLQRELANLSISAGSLVVGRATVPSNTAYTLYHAFAWGRGAIQDLNNLIPAGSGWVLNEATGVNDAGMIIGYGTLGGQTRAFRLTRRRTVATSSDHCFFGRR